MTITKTQMIDLIEGFISTVSALSFEVDGDELVIDYSYPCDETEDALGDFVDDLEEDFEVKNVGDYCVAEYPFEGFTVVVDYRGGLED